MHSEYISEESNRKPPETSHDSKTALSIISGFCYNGKCSRCKDIGEEGHGNQCHKCRLPLIELLSVSLASATLGIECAMQLFCSKKLMLIAVYVAEEAY